MTPVISAKRTGWEKLKYRLGQIAQGQRRTPEEQEGEIFEFEWDDSPDWLMVCIKLVMFACVTAFIVVPATQLAAEIYAVGGLVNWIAIIMVSICQAGGSCSAPMLLSSITLGVLMLTAMLMLILIPIRFLVGGDPHSDLHGHMQLLGEKLDALYEHLKASDPAARKKLWEARDRRLRNVRARVFIAAMLFMGVTLIVATSRLH